MVLSQLRVPVVCVLIGEGGSGGALALAVADRIAMLEHSVYSILSPEGFASILWKDSGKATQAADVMKMTAREVHALGIIDEVLPEPGDGAQADPQAMALTVKKYLQDTLQSLCAQPIEGVLERRYQRLRGFGQQYLR